MTQKRSSMNGKGHPKDFKIEALGTVSIVFKPAHKPDAFFSTIANRPFSLLA